MGQHKRGVPRGQAGLVLPPQLQPKTHPDGKTPVRGEAGNVCQGPLGGNRRGQGRKGDTEREIGWGQVCRLRLCCVPQIPKDSIQPHTSSEVEERGEKG